MFGVIVSGRPVDVSPIAITQTQYAFHITTSPPFSHIVIFLLPGTQLPAGTAVTIHAQMHESLDFKLLGGIGPGKESAVFKISGLMGESDAMRDDISANANGDALADMVIGVSIESAEQVHAQLANLNYRSNGRNDAGLELHAPTSVTQNSSLPRSNATRLLAQKIIENAFNFLASFGSDTVPLKAFQEWWKKFEQKIELDPFFLESLN